LSFQKAGFFLFELTYDKNFSQLMAPAAPLYAKIMMSLPTDQTGTEIGMKFLPSR
jgi:hypothetical protein